VTEAMQRAERQVLVWQLNRGEAVAHDDPDCRSLAGKLIPKRDQRFQGPGTVGWLSITEARHLRNEGSVRFCQACT
jgi:hypothetical protein